MNDKSKILLNTIFSAAIFLALLTGLSYILGYSYLEGFYSRFGIPIMVIEISKEQFLLYGSPWLSHLFIFGGLSVLLYWAINLPNDSSNSLQNKLFQQLKKVLNKLSQFNPWTFLLAALLIFIPLFFGYSILKPIHEKGKELGSNYALCSAPLTEVVYKDETATVKKKQLGLLTISKGDYFFFEPTNIAEKTPDVIILQKESLFSVKTIGKVKIKTKIDDCKPPQTPKKTKSCC